MQAASCGPGKQHQLRTMATYQNVMLRMSIVLGMVAAVVTILYFTPMPDQNFKSCDRPCHELDWPMICRITLDVELHELSQESCGMCPFNGSLCGWACGGGALTAGRQLPGPAIQVCHNDVLVVDVVNRVAGRSLAVHWRGQPNADHPHMDGAPMVTQCPIASFTTFQYKFRATAAGTHLYHAHSDADRSGGLFGALIVRQSDKLDPQRRLYDRDLKEHVMVVSEWGVTGALLVNGGGSGTAPPPTFDVRRGRRYRFRAAFAAGGRGCPVALSVDGHPLKVIALDGNPVAPHEVGSVELGKGERVDFVLKASQDVSTYTVRVRARCGNATAEGRALLRYEGAAGAAGAPEGPPVRRFTTAMCTSSAGQVCLGDVRALHPPPEVLTAADEEMRRTIYLGFNSKVMIKNGDDVPSRVHTANNITFAYPSAPLLSQPGDVPTSVTCNDLKIPETCAGHGYCECVHLEYIPMDSATEIFLIDQGGDEDEQIFHFHGHKFYVVGARLFERPPTVDEVKELNRDAKFERNLNNPALKDTVRVPRYGVVAIRFVTNNPGFWLLRDEKSRGWTRGYDVLFQVGDLSEMASPPSNFPICGSFIGPDFFLM